MCDIYVLIFTVIIFTIIFVISIYIKIYILQGGHSVGCDRTNTHTHTHTHAHTQYGGMTALHLAARYGHGGVAEALLKAGCKPDIQDTV